MSKLALEDQQFESFDGHISGTPRPALVKLVRSEERFFLLVEFFLFCERREEDKQGLLLPLCEKKSDSLGTQSPRYHECLQEVSCIHLGQVEMGKQNIDNIPLAVLT